MKIAHIFDFTLVFFYGAWVTTILFASMPEKVQTIIDILFVGYGMAVISFVVWLIIGMWRRLRCSKQRSERYTK